MDNSPLAIAVDLLSVGLICLTAWRLGVLRWFFRVPLATLIGWPIVTISVAIHWQVLALAASTPAEMEWVASHDTGPLAAALVLGWAYALILVLATELVRAVAFGIRRLAAHRLGA